METGRKAAQLFHGLFLFAIIMYGAVIVALPRIMEPVFQPGDYELNVITWMLTAVASISVICGFFIPRWMTRRNKGNPKKAQAALSAHIVRCSFFESIAVFGLILALLGAAMEMALAFLIISAAVLLMTFPTAERWQKMTE